MTKQLNIKLLTAMLLFASLGHVTADMYVPSLPAITIALKSTPTEIQLTLTAFMLGFSFAHLFYGPISDRIGRRRPILVGIGISIIGSFFCLIATSVTSLIIGRLIQGMGVAVCNSVGRSLVRDLLTGPHLAKIGSHLGMIVVFVTATAPTLGGYIQYYFDWHIVFFALLAYTTFVWIFAWKILPETNFYLDPSATEPKKLIKNYLKVISDKEFLGYTLCVTFAYSGIIAYVTNGPFLLQTIIGLSPIQYGWLAFVIGSAIFTSFFINSRTVLIFGIARMALVGTLLMILSGAVMLLFAAFDYINTWVIIVPVAFFCMGAGFTFTNGTAGAFQPFTQLVGSAGALFGCIQILGGAATSALIAKMHFNNQLPLALIFTSTGLLAFLSWKLLATADKFPIKQAVMNN